MARPRTFDEARALGAAMHTFWVKGYAATSTQDLCDATGLGRSSIYNTFSSKHDLFTRALACYMETMTSRQVAILEDPEPSALERIRALFAVIVDGEAEGGKDGRSPGCLVVNTVVERARCDPEAAEMVRRDLDRRLAALCAVLEAGQRAGVITCTRDARSLAHFLNATISGIRVSGQGGADRATLEAIAATAVDALRS